MVLEGAGYRRMEGGCASKCFKIRKLPPTSYFVNIVKLFFSKNTPPMLGINVNR